MTKFQAGLSILISSFIISCGFEPAHEESTNAGSEIFGSSEEVPSECDTTTKDSQMDDEKGTDDQKGEHKDSNQIAKKNKDNGQSQNKDSDDNKGGKASDEEKSGSETDKNEDDNTQRNCPDSKSNSADGDFEDFY